MRIRCWQLGVVLAVVAGLMSGCKGSQEIPMHTIPEVQPISTGGYAPRGEQIMVQRRCGACHTIPGIHGANGVVGPPLIMFGRRSYIAGNFPNTPAYLVRWIMSPKSLKPNTAMPDLGLSQQQARDVAAYLYTLR